MIRRCTSTSLRGRALRRIDTRHGVRNGFFHDLGSGCPGDAHGHGYAMAVHWHLRDSGRVPQRHLLGRPQPHTDLASPPYWRSQSIFFPLTSARQDTKWVAGDLGLAFVVAALVVALAFWGKRGALPVDRLSATRP